ncbi:uncharacterized protein NPIL_406591 [Nephila pilipes]|uniref:EGF-like domain-containing protein n=1 Tax=Nephila pilipes TaxID=299642 RepID=A0A8X6MVD2_NEPPI|nr:uncharacterized protein NPIL_406591 [Nephila pilipes]
MSSFHSCFNAFLLLLFYSTVKANHDDLNRTILDDAKVRLLLQQERLRTILSEKNTFHEGLCAPGHSIQVLGRTTCLCPDGYVSSDGKCVEQKCSNSILCWPGKCILINDKETCLCPEGYVATYGICKRIKKRCQRSLDCFPGQCVIMNDREVCLCPPGLISEQGFCKESDRMCYKLDCKPGKCISESGTEKCLCPAGFTAKDEKCIEIFVKVPGKLTTVMLMVLVAAASVILTTLFGVAICYYISQRN